MPAGSHQQSSNLGSRNNQNWDALAGMSAPKRSRDHDYEDPAGLMYRFVSIIYCIPFVRYGISDLIYDATVKLIIKVVFGDN